MTDVLWPRWSRQAEGSPEREAIVRFVSGAQPHRWSWADPSARAERAAHDRAKCGVQPGHVYSIFMRHGPHFHPLYLGVVASGAMPAEVAGPTARNEAHCWRRGRPAT